VDIARGLSRFGYVPAFVGGVILSGILASTMSTADSQLLAAASGVSQNLAQETFKIKISQKASMWLARITVIVISIVAVFIAWDQNSSVFRVVSFAWAGFGATFGPAMLCALFWKRANKAGIIAGMIGGGVTVFLWKFVIAKLGGVWAIYELLPAFIVGLVLIIVVSLLTKKPEQELVDTFDELNAEMKASK
jgi:sodium/proline symporter